MVGSILIDRWLPKLLRQDDIGSASLDQRMSTHIIDQHGRSSVKVQSPEVVCNARRLHGTRVQKSR